jgi:hypothetical protein
LSKIFFDIIRKISIVAIKCGDKKRGWRVPFQTPLKTKIKRIENQWFLILLTFILDNSGFFYKFEHKNI